MRAPCRALWQPIKAQPTSTARVKGAPPFLRERLERYRKRGLDVTLMRRLNVERGLTFLIVTHDIAVGLKTDRIIRMVDGEVVGDDLPTHV